MLIKVCLSVVDGVSAWQTAYQKTARNPLQTPRPARENTCNIQKLNEIVLFRIFGRPFTKIYIPILGSRNPKFSRSLKLIKSIYKAFIKNSRVADQGQFWATYPTSKLIKSIYKAFIKNSRVADQGQFWATYPTSKLIKSIYKAFIKNSRVADQGQFWATYPTSKFPQFQFPEIKRKQKKFTNWNHFWQEFRLLLCGHCLLFLINADEN